MSKPPNGRSGKSASSPRASAASGKPRPARSASGEPPHGKSAPRKPGAARPAHDEPAHGKAASAKPRAPRPAHDEPFRGKSGAGKPGSARPAHDEPAHGKPAPGKSAPAKAERPELLSRKPVVAPVEEGFKIAGLSAVSAVFAVRPQAVEKLIFDERLEPELGELCAAMAAARRPYRMVGTEELGRIAGSALHGGVVAFVKPKVVAQFDPEEAKLWAAQGQPLVILDGVGNPHNLGAIARTMAFFGLNRLVLTDHPAQAAPSEAAYRVAEGGLEYVEVYRALRFPIGLKRLHPGYRVIGTALGQGKSLLPADLSRTRSPVALVLGNEEHGLPPATLAVCDEVVMIPGAGQVQSLNVSVTAAILINALAAKAR